MKRLARGYTLIEMMAVVAILAVMVTLAVGGLEPTVVRLRVAQGADQVQEAMALARSTARASGRCTHLDLVNPAPPLAVMALPELGAGLAGTQLRLWRARDATCPSPPTNLNSDLLETFTLPDDTGVTFASGADAVWLANGRLSSGAATVLQIDRKSSHIETAQGVIVQPWGPSCAYLLSSGAPTCP